MSMRWHPVWRLALRVQRKSEQVDACGSGQVLGQALAVHLKAANIDIFRISLVIPLSYAGCPWRARRYRQCGRKPLAFGTL